MSRSITRALPLVALFLVAGCADREAPEPESAATSSADDAPPASPDAQAERELTEAEPEEPAASAAPSAYADLPEGTITDDEADDGTRSPVASPPSPRAKAAPRPLAKRPPAYAPDDLGGGESGGKAKEEKKQTYRPRPRGPQKLGAAKPGRRKPGALALADKAKNERGNAGRFGGRDDRGILAQGQIPKNMYFEHYGTNPTIDTEEEPRSTFAVDVDTASFSMARSFLDRGVMPSEAAIRVEEIVNAFDYGYEPPPSHGERAKTFTVHAEAAPSPNRRGYHFLHIGVKGKEIARAKRKSANLVFVIDVSGSMSADNRLGLVKQSLRLLVSQLGEADRVGIVTYGSSARQRLQPTSAHNKARILQVIDELKTEGATNAEAGLREGYAMAARHLRQDGGVNRVVLLSDGVANVGVTGPGGILETVRQQVQKGITLTSVGFGMGNYNDVLMEQLADKGNGNYHYVDRLSEARRVFVDNLTGTLQVIAKDVKVQVDFDPKVVARYRLIGYENRALKARQFDDDRVDAGELGAGHSVTALYEVRLVPGATAALGKVRVRFKQPHGSQSQLVETSLSRTIMRPDSAGLTSPSQLSMAAAQFAEKLRGSYWARTVSYDEIASRLDGLAPALKAQSQVRELIRLVEKAEELDSRVDKFQSQGLIARMDFDRVPVLR